MYKLLALDLDGTLLNKEKIISKKNLDTLKKAQDLGLKVVITTGRPLRGIAPFIDMLGLKGKDEYAITFNGGLVQNLEGDILGKTVLEFSQIKKVYEIFKKLDLPLSVLSEEKVLELPTSKNHPSNYSKLNPLLTYENWEVDDLTPDRIYNKFVSATDAAILDTKIPFIPESLKEEFGIMKSRANLLEVLPKEVSKANALKLLGDILNIKPEEIMAFGDEENDLSMIDYAFGVVMENGNPKVKEHADFITLSNEEDGVAYGIEQLILKEAND